MVHDDTLHVYVHDSIKIFMLSVHNNYITHLRMCIYTYLLLSDVSAVEVIVRLKPDKTDLVRVSTILADPLFSLKLYLFALNFNSA